MSRHALQRESRALFERNIVGQGNQAVRAHQASLRISTGLPRVRHAVTRLHIVDTIANRFDDAGSFDSRSEWGFTRVSASAVAQRP